MDRDTILRTLREHRNELQQLGVDSISLFGSAARGEERPADIDLAVRLSAEFSSGGFEYFGKIESLGIWISAVLDSPVDIVEEPVRTARFQHEINKDRVIAF